MEESGDQLKLTIRDDGPGHAKNDLPHLFDRFYKGKNGNHGLGLPAQSVHGILGGDIAAESSPDGAVFTIILDVMMPKINGLDVLRQLRSEGCKTPILLLTAKAEVEDRIQGLDLRRR